ncbi:hypothetical protein WJX77_004509 [Trebouxia sp. C0004]
MWEVVPSGKVAYLEDGWVDSGYLQCLTGPDKREVLANQVGILMPSGVLCLQPLSTPFDPHYRLATRQDGLTHKLGFLDTTIPAMQEPGNDIDPTGDLNAA